ncbi:MAG: HAD-IA family hydrolase [Casimicrobium sp.]
MKSEQSLEQLLVGKRLLIFDFDGTIADTSPLHASAFTQVLAPLGVPVDYSSIAGMSTGDALRMLFSQNGRELPPALLAELVSRKQSMVRDMISSHLLPMPHVDDFLRWARSRYRLSVATSGSRGTVRLALAALGYEDWFDPVVCADDVLRSKPHPDVFLAVLRLTQTAAVEALVFEDSDTGIAAAAAASLRACDVRLGAFAQRAWNEHNDDRRE